MILNPNTLVLDIKLTDEMREWLSTLGNEDLLSATCVILGDSDIDYNLAPKINTTRILEGPYNPPAVKYKLIYNGVGQDLSGTIKTFARYVNTDGTISSLYDYPTTSNFTSGTTPPSLENGKDFDQITFQDVQMGYILYFETVLDFYLDDDGTKERLNEDYTFTILWDGSATIPAGWDYVIDTVNGSMLLAKTDTTTSPIGTNYRGKITVFGNTSNKTKVVTFNY